LTRRKIDTIEVDGCWLRHILRHWAIWTTDTVRRRDTFAKAVRSKRLTRFVRRCIIDISFFCKVDHSQDNFSIFGSSVVDIFGNNWVEQIIICVAFFDELIIKNGR